VRAVIVSPVKRQPESEEKPVSPMQARLMEVVGSVEAAQESVMSALRYGQQQRKAGPGDKECSGKSSRVSRAVADDIKAVQDLDTHHCMVAEEKTAESVADDDLQDTLDEWLEQHKGLVTVRNKKPIQRAPAPGGRSLATKIDEQLVDTVQDDDDAMLYSTVTKTVSRFRVAGFKAYSEDEFDDYDDDDNDNDNDNGNGNHPLRGNMDGDDVEVVNMQCMLAKALMDEDDDDDDDLVTTSTRK
jgi:hypothetical protein